MADQAKLQATTPQKSRAGALCSLVRRCKPTEANSFSVAIHDGAQAVHAVAIGRTDEALTHKRLEALPGDVQSLCALLSGDQPISEWLLLVKDGHKARFFQFIGGGAVNLSNATLALPVALEKAA